MAKVTQVISLGLWIVGLIFVIVSLIPSLGGGGGDKLMFAAVLFLGGICGMAVAGVWS